MDELEVSSVAASVFNAMESDEARNWIDFIAASVFMALQRARQARLTGDLLRLAAFSALEIPPDPSNRCNELRNKLVAIPTDDLHALGRELRRSSLITVVGILDFCLFEVLLFMVSVRPCLLNKMPEDLQKRKRHRTDPLASAKESLKRSSIDTLLKRAKEVLQIEAPEQLLTELGPLLEKRHAITHRSKFYETVLADGKAIIQAHAFPEVSYDESTIALITVTELADYLLTGIARDYFHSDLEDLRPLNPAVAELHQAMRLEIQKNREQGPEVEIVENPNWNVVARDEATFVTDGYRVVIFYPVDLLNYAISVHCPKHDIHGEKAYITIDDGDKEQADFMDAAFLARLLAGKSILIEYQSISSDVPICFRLSLEGFAAKWQEVLGMFLTKKGEPKANLHSLSGEDDFKSPARVTFSGSTALETAWTGRSF